MTRTRKTRSSPYLFFFGFYAKDNAGALKTDYIEANFNSDVISFTLPYGTDPDALKTLVPEFTVTEGASVNVADASGAPDGNDLVSGVSAIDCSSDVQLVVFLKNNYKAYTLSVKVAEPARWEKVAETSLSVKYNPALAVNPKDGVPYVAGTSPNEMARLHRIFSNWMVLNSRMLQVHWRLPRLMA